MFKPEQEFITDQASAVNRLYVTEPDLSQAIAVVRRSLLMEDGAQIVGLPKMAALSDFRELGSIEGRVLPTGSKSTLEFVTQYGGFSFRNIRFSAGNIKFFEKDYGYRIAHECGLATPATWKTFEEIPKAAEIVFVKPAWEGPGLKIPVPRDRAAAFLRRNYVAQEYIRSNGVFGYGFIADNGRVLAAASHHEIRSWPRHGGSAAVLKRHCDPKFDDLCKGFIRDIAYTGWGLLEFAWSDSLQNYVFFELNAKLWASIEFSFRTAPVLSQVLLGVTERETCREHMVFISRLADLPSWEAIGWLGRGNVTIAKEPGDCLTFARRWLKRRFCRTTEP